MEQKFLKLSVKDKVFKKDGKEIPFKQPIVNVGGMEIELYIQKGDFRGKQAIKDYFKE